MLDKPENIIPNRCFLLYDGTCPLCIRITNFLRRTDRRSVINFLPLNSDEANDLLKMYCLSSEEMDSVVFIGKSGLSTMSEAVLNVFKTVGGLWSLMYIFILVPRGLRDHIYKFIARNRFRLYNKKCAC